MKLRLFLFLFLACTLVTGSAMAQGCSTKPLQFPPSGGNDIGVPSGTCIASLDSAGNQSGRLRWDNGGNGILQLFDTDDGGQSLWCALQAGSCARGRILCLQQDGNAVIYTGSDCGGVGSDPDVGTALWASNTSGNCGLFGNCTNEDTEELFVQDNLSVNGVHIGEAAVIYNDTHQGSDEGRVLLWHSNSSD
ncbi:MAG TPA: hypothetical protein VKY85_05750 [Candidatus Angelobacter sp.]|nr:hypothetical protein [Candidatus Angelobacter sp.]